MNVLAGQRFRRFHRPFLLLPVCGSLWALDEFQPVAAVLDPATCAVRAVVDWRTVPPPAPGDVTRVATDRRALWLQVGAGGDLVRLDETGVRQVVSAPGVALSAVGDGAAWCVDAQPVVTGRPLGPGRHEPSPPLPPGRLVVADADGVRTIPVDRPVRQVTAGPDGRYLEVDWRPPDPVPAGEWGWHYAYHRRQVRLPSPLPERIEVGRYAECVAEVPPEERWNHGGASSLLHRYNAARVRTHGVPAAGLHWVLGPLAGAAARGAFPPMIATGHDPETGTEQVRVDLGAGRTRTATGTAEHLWTVVRRTVDDVELLRVHRDGFAVALPAGRLDITGRCWSPRHPGTGTVTEQVRAALADARGMANLADVTDLRATVDGDWPDTRVRVSFRHPYLPGGTLTRSWPVFDEVGRPGWSGNEGVFLMEDLDCGLLPPPGDAVGGVLEI